MLAFLCRDAHLPVIGDSDATRKQSHDEKSQDVGLRTSLAVPLLKDNEKVGLISLARNQVQPFSDNQISLFRDFAAQASSRVALPRGEMFQR